MCGTDDGALAQAVVAHEMAHVALLHHGTAGVGIVREWEDLQRREAQADALGLAALRLTGASQQAMRVLERRNPTVAVVGATQAQTFRADPVK